MKLVQEDRRPVRASTPPIACDADLLQAAHHDELDLDDRQRCHDDIGPQPLDARGFFGRQRRIGEQQRSRGQIGMRLGHDLQPVDAVSAGPLNVQDDRIEVNRPEKPSTCLNFRTSRKQS